MRRLTILLCGLMLVFGVATAANAVPISGEMYFNGIAFDSSFEAATATVLPSLTSFVLLATEDLSPLTGTFVNTNSFTFNPASSPAAAPLWTAGDFSFTLDTVGITVQSGNQLGLAGLGTLSSTILGLDDTPYSWDINITDGTCAFNFSQTTAPVPEPATMLLLGTGLAGMTMVRRRRTRKS